MVHSPYKIEFNLDFSLPCLGNNVVCEMFQIERQNKVLETLIVFKKWQMISNSSWWEITLSIKKKGRKQKDFLGEHLHSTVYWMVNIRSECVIKCTD